MKYTLKYPNAQPLEEVEPSIVRGENVHSQPCWNCNEDTPFVELSFLAHLCSDECTEAKWDEYFKAGRKRVEELESSMRDKGNNNE